MFRPFVGSGVAGLVFITLAAACSSFSGSIDPSGGVSNDGGGTDGGFEATPVAVACANGDEVSGWLFVVGGDTAEDGESSQIARASVRCNGSLDTFSLETTAMPRTTSGGGAVVLDGRLVLFGGRHGGGGPPVSDDAWVARIGFDGSLGPFSPTTLGKQLERQRFAVAGFDTRAYILGGQVENPSDYPAGLVVQSGTQWKTSDSFSLSFVGDTLTLQPFVPTVLPMDRFAAAGGAQKLVTAINGEVQVISLGANGEASGTWTTIASTGAAALDQAAVPASTSAYFFGGTQGPNQYTSVDLAEAAPVLRFGNPLSKDHAGPVVAAARGFVYVLDQGEASIQYGRLGEASLTLTSGPSVPGFVRALPSLVVAPRR